MTCRRVALALACGGIYSVMAYTVVQRRREIGVRIALGASAANVLRVVLGQGLTTVAAGVAIGALGAIALTRTMQSMLFGVTATDPLTFGLVIGVLAAVATLACYVPARRGTRVDPIEVLRRD